VLLIPLVPLASLATAGGSRWYQTAADTPTHVMGALMSGMVILMIPAFFICTGIAILAYRKRKQWTESETRSSYPPTEPPNESNDELWR